jgi:hypothetical protein
MISLVFSPSISLKDDGPGRHSTLSRSPAFSHRSICVWNVILTLLSLAVSLVRLYSCNLLSQPLPLPIHKILVIPVVLLNFGAFLSAGNMRRGPKLYHPVPPMQLGSGLQASEEEVTEEVRLWLAGEDGGEEPEANVLDYAGCGVLSLTFAGYVSAFVELWIQSERARLILSSDYCR